MAQQALPAGAVRRRAVFGLFDADGWSWAGIKAAFWFMVFVFLLAYIPNVAYYFTVSDTVKVGYNVLSPINWCPSTNDTLPCPAPAGAVVPWQTSPTTPISLSLPAALSGAVVAQSGVHIYVVGGTTAAGVTADVQTTQVGEDGNFVPWVAGPSVARAAHRRRGRVHDRCALRHRWARCGRQADRHRVRGHGRER